MKRMIAALSAVWLLLSLCACGQTASVAEESAPKDIDLTLWVYPLGQWADKDAVASFLETFTDKYPHIHIDVTYLDEETADATVCGAMEAAMTPDLLLGNVKPLVTRFSDEGTMADLSSLCNGCDIYKNILTACTGEDGGIYMAPLFLNVYCMAFNQYLFEDADVLQYADLENHSWNSSDFFDAEIEMFDYGTTDFASVYCRGQNGDYGTRAFVTGLYGGGLVDENGCYALTNDQNLRALKKLVRYKGFRWDETMLAEDAAYLFSRGEYAATLCWSADMAREYTADFPVIPMAYPTEDGSIGNLPGDVWGLSVFDHQDTYRLEAAQQLITYLYENDEAYEDAVRLSGYFSAREGFTLYADDALLAPYEMLSTHMVPEQQDTDNWTGMRTAWCDMLNTIATTEDIGESGIRAAMEAFDSAANQE